MALFKWKVDRLMLKRIDLQPYSNMILFRYPNSEWMNERGIFNSIIRIGRRMNNFEFWILATKYSLFGKIRVNQLNFIFLQLQHAHTIHSNVSCCFFFDGYSDSLRIRNITNSLRLSFYLLIVSCVRVYFFFYFFVGVHSTSSVFWDSSSFLFVFSSLFFLLFFLLFSVIIWCYSCGDRVTYTNVASDQNIPKIH